MREVTWNKWTLKFNNFSERALAVGFTTASAITEAAVCRRSSKYVLKKFRNIHKKTLYQLYLQLHHRDTPTQTFSCGYCEIFKNINFYRTPPVAVSVAEICCRKITVSELKNWFRQGATKIAHKTKPACIIYFRVSACWKRFNRYPNIYVCVRPTVCVTFLLPPSIKGLKIGEYFKFSRTALFMEHLWWLLLSLWHIAYENRYVFHN